ncbi:MAG TPA: DUF4082 domain-containing protein, partial [Chloroflexota bacterium]|nr:DUF4082 domain-containing protein [Chloroflexota bacterium]
MNVHKKLLALSAIAAVVLSATPVRAAGAGDVASPPINGGVTMTNQTPTIVLNGTAVLLGPRDPAAPMAINMILPLRNQANLQLFVTNAASHGIYLSQQQFDDQFGVPASQVQAVQQWGSANNLQTTFSAPDGTIVTLHGATSAVAAALHVSINNYRSPKGFTFYSNNQDAVVPASLGVIAVDGLNNIPRFHTDSQTASKALFHAALAKSHGSAKGHTAGIRPNGDLNGFFPADFRAAYDVTGHSIDGTGQVIGFTLWGAPVPNTDFTNMATTTGEPAIVGGPAQNGGTATSTTADHIDWIYTNGVDTTTDAQVETAMDTEYAHGMAPHAHLRYWLGDQVGTCPQCGGSDVGLENAITDAANDPQVHVVSNSWGGGEAPSLSDPFYTATNNEFLHAVSVGTTFYFSSGDSGSDSGGTGLPSYPADAPNVVSVGGTSLFVNSDGSYSSESVWNDSPFDGGGGGAGCSAIVPEPSFQNIAAVNNVATCKLTANTATRGRAEPDVSADADPNTGAAVFSGGGEQEIGGTSLAAPLWAGMAALADRFASVNGRTRIGWAAPKIYTLANTPAKYATDFHDVTSGNTNGSISFSAGTGWDQATGWGSIDWFKWVQDMVPAPTVAATTTTLSSSLNPSTSGQSVTFTAHVTSASGTPTGTVSFRDNGTQIGTGTLASGSTTFATSSLAVGSHPITAVYLGATGFAGSTSTTVSQVVNATGPTGTSIFTTQTPAATFSGAFELGVKFRSTAAGQITGLRYFRPASETGTHTGHLWSATGTLLGTVTFSGETASGWQTATFSTPIAISANTTYISSVNSNTAWAGTTSGLTSSVSNGPLSTVADGQNGVYT